MKILLSSVLLLSLGACSTMDQREARQDAKEEKRIEKVAEKSEAKYGGKCAMAMCLKKDVQGDEKYSVDYKGNHYIFSSPEARDNFLSKIDTNIMKADQEWARSTNRTDSID